MVVMISSRHRAVLKTGIIAGILAFGLAAPVVLAHGVTGRVLDPDHNPIAGAEAELESSGGVFRRAETDAAGAFEITGVGSGTFNFAAWAEGYATRLVPGLEIDLGDGEADLGAIHLDPGVTVVGLVADSKGRPLEDVAVWSAAPRLKSWHQGATHRTTTDAEGFFAIPNLPRRALLELSIFRDGFQNRTVRQVVTQREAPLVVVMVPGFSLRGRVLDAGGRPVDRAELRLSRGDGYREGSRSDEEGRFQYYRQPPGRVTLCVRAEEGLAGPLEAEIGPDHDQEMEIVLAPGAAIDGHLSSPDGQSVVEAKITLDRNPPESGGAVVRGALRGVEPGEIAWLRIRASSAVHDERTGSFSSPFGYRITGLEAGEWTVEAFLPGTGRAARGRVTVEGTGDEAVLDLELTGPEER